MFLECVVYIIPLDKHISPTTYLVYVVAVADVTIVVAAVGNVADGRRVAHGETILHTTLWANLSQIILTLFNFIFLFFWLERSFKVLMLSLLEAVPGQTCGCLCRVPPWWPGDRGGPDQHVIPLDNLQCLVNTNLAFKHNCHCWNVKTSSCVKVKFYQDLCWQVPGIYLSLSSPQILLDFVTFIGIFLYAFYQYMMIKKASIHILPSCLECE